MKPSFFIVTIYMLIITISSTNAMERSLILSQKPNYESSSKLSTLQLKLPKDTFDPFDKIFAYCSHTTRSILQLTCKQFYLTASINNLNKLVMHDFVIGDEKEKAKFFKALIKTSNPQLITPFLRYAKKEAKSLKYNLTDIVIDINNIPEKDVRNKQYIHTTYLIPLLQEAIEQDNKTMLNQITKENIDTAIIDQLYKTKQRQTICSIAGAGGGVCCTITIITVFGGVLFAIIDSIIHPCINCIN